MTLDERWLKKNGEVKSFREANCQNLSKHSIEEQLMLNRVKHNHKLLKADKMALERVEMIELLVGFVGGE